MESLLLGFLHCLHIAATAMFSESSFRFTILFPCASILPIRLRNPNFNVCERVIFCRFLNFSSVELFNFSELLLDNGLNILFMHLVLLFSASVEDKTSFETELEALDKLKSTVSAILFFQTLHLPFLDLALSLDFCLDFIF